METPHGSQRGPLKSPSGPSGGRARQLCGLSHHATPLPELLAPSTLLLLPKCARLAPTSGPLHGGSPCRQLPPTPAWLHLPSIGSLTEVSSARAPRLPPRVLHSRPPHTQHHVSPSRSVLGGSDFSLFALLIPQSPEKCLPHRRRRGTGACLAGSGGRQMPRPPAGGGRPRRVSAEGCLNSSSSSACKLSPCLIPHSHLSPASAFQPWRGVWSLACMGDVEGGGVGVTVGTSFASTPRAWLWPVLAHSSMCPRGWQGCTLAPRCSSHG